MLILCILFMLIAWWQLWYFRNKNFGYSSLFNILLYRNLVVLAILVVETIVYWFLGSRPIKRSWAWAHIICLFIATIGVPLLFVLALYITRGQTISRYFNLRVITGAMRIVFFYGSVIVGHVFFILSLIKGFSRQVKVELLTSEQGILDDYYQTK